MRTPKEVYDTLFVVFTSRSYLLLGIVSFIGFLALYLFTLPATYTGGRIGFISLRLLTVKLVVFSFILALLIALIIPLTVYSYRQGAKARKSIVTGGFIGSISPPLLCCSPLIPSAIAFLGIVSPTAFSFGGAIQGFVATYETYILLGATLLLVFALVQTAKSTRQCLC